ncbi:MAG: N-acetylglucosamine-6-phosphate deacetylase [Armatimonadetes bacterium]|nr:N-acetylglucosamine-6-phosphate deacetylase [Armatimonadota bacterium]
MSDRLALVGGRALTPEGEIKDATVLVEGGRIRAVGPGRDVQPEPGSRILDARGMLILPGFIDTHIHGSHGDDVMLHGEEGIHRIAADLLRYGVTSWQPSTLSARHDDLMRAIEGCRRAAERPRPGARIVGIHIEGPYINVRKKGAQPEEGIRPPDPDQCRQYLGEAGGLARIMTLAPELDGAEELMKLLREENVVISLGHSEADYDLALHAIECGASHATHLFNAMPALNHREPGLAAACLNEPEITAEIIADGIHLHPQVVNLAFRAKGPEKIALVTDAMSAVGMPDGTYTLGAHTVLVEGDRCTLADGTIASSMLTMNRAVRNAMAFAGASWGDAARMTAEVPARLSGVLHDRGTLEAGKRADLAVLREDGGVAYTILEGAVAFEGTPP